MTPAALQRARVSLLKRLPDAAFSRKFLVNGGTAWILVRAALFFVGDAVADVFGAPTLALELPASVALIAICSGLVVVNVLRLHERILLANLGVPLGVVALIGAIPALLGEIVATILATMLGT